MESDPPSPKAFGGKIVSKHWMTVPNLIVLFSRRYTSAELVPCQRGPGGLGPDTNPGCRLGKGSPRFHFSPLG